MLVIVLNLVKLKIKIIFKGKESFMEKGAKEFTAVVDSITADRKFTLYI